MLRQGFCKAVVLSPTVGIDGKAVAGAVVGLHYLGPNAGEVIMYYTSSHLDWIDKEV
jgi:hypothetical protein